jgi:predicted RNA-binding Zn-ribbon protein involved in translation (DUF1610 family)
MEENNVSTATIQKDHRCVNCAAVLEFKPGTARLSCIYCGAENEIAAPAETVEEQDFSAFISQLQHSSEKMSVKLVKCDACGAETTFDEKIVSDNCAFCGNQITVTQGTSSELIRPKSLLPFKIDQKQGFAEFQKWVKSLWFAPSGLVRSASKAEKLLGIYIPYWTYDSSTTSPYTGERGENYTVNETYTTVEDGKSVTRTRTVTRTRWYPAYGTISHDFDDVLVLASSTLPLNYTNKLEPWDLDQLTGFDAKFLSGFKAEAYQIGLEEGFERAKKIMDTRIRELITRDIGGDHQRIHSVKTSHSDIKFKHLLLPVWLSTFKHSGKLYRFMINGRTGEVQGERPYSASKITWFILTLLAVIAGIVFLVMHFKK